MPLFSLSFLIFMLCVILVYYLVPRRGQWIVILIASYVFYFLGAGLLPMVFILFTTITTFYAAKMLDSIKNRYKDDRKQAITKKKRVMAVCLLANFGILAVLKYGNFFVENLNALFSRFGAGSLLPEVKLLLPLGISFYTFQTMGYLIDVYRGKYEPDKSLFRFALFTSYFPQIIQGPIGRHNELSKELYKEHVWDDTRFKEGFLRLLWGYFKKMVIAERAGVIVNEIFGSYESNPEYKGFIILIGVLLYSIQVYADFSGGMDIVLGASEILGIRLSENFRRPFFARSVTEFWQRWHITLGAWMKDYVFYPLCLSKLAKKLQKKFKKKYGSYYARILIPTFASFITFIVVGIWHGAEWKYVVYGIFMAFFVSTNTLFERQYEKLRNKFHIDGERFVWKGFQIIRTIGIITVGRLLSRGASIRGAARMFRAMVSSWNPWVFTDGSLYNLGLTQKSFQLLLLGIVLFFIVDLINERGRIIRKGIAAQILPIRWAVYYIGILSVLVFGIYGAGYDAASFIYQNF